MGSHPPKIEKNKIRAIRTITFSKRRSLTDYLFKQLNILNVTDIYKLTAIKFYYNLKRNSLPKNFDNFISHTNLRVTLRYQLPVLITTMPCAIINKVNTHSYNGFSRYANKMFISSYSETCMIVDCFICQNHNYFSSGIYFICYIIIIIIILII